MIDKLSILSVVRLILLTGILSLFFACASSDPNKAAGIPTSLEEFKEKEGDSNTNDATQAYWAIPEPYANLSIEQIKSQIEITDYMVIKGAATDAGSEESDVEVSSKGISRSIVAGGGAVEKEAPKNIRDRTALASYTNKLISLEGVVNTTGTQKSAPLDIEERTPGKYEVWFCADKNQKRKPCRNRTHLLYEAPEGKGDTLFTHDNVIRFWGVILGEQIDVLIYSGYRTFKRYPKIRVVDLEVIK